VHAWHVDNFRPFPAHQDAALLFKSLNHVSALKRSPYTGHIFSSHTRSLFYFDPKTKKLVDVLPDQPWQESYISDFDWLNDSILIIGMAERNFILKLNLRTNEVLPVYLKGISDVQKVERVGEHKLILVDRLAGVMEYQIGVDAQPFIFCPTRDATQQSWYYHSFLQDLADRRWVGTQSGVALFEENHVNYFKHVRANNNFNAVYDVTHGICITNGYEGSLLWKIKNNQFVSIPFDFKGISPWSIVFSPQQGLFYSLEENRMVAFHPTTHFRKEFKLSALINNTIL
jgi:hypothetical protein